MVCAAYCQALLVPRAVGVELERLFRTRQNRFGLGILRRQIADQTDLFVVRQFVATTENTGLEKRIESAITPACDEESSRYAQAFADGNLPDHWRTISAALRRREGSLRFHSFPAAPRSPDVHIS